MNDVGAMLVCTNSGLLGLMGGLMIAAMSSGVIGTCSSQLLISVFRLRYPRDIRQKMVVSCFLFAVRVVRFGFKRSISRRSSHSR